MPRLPTGVGLFAVLLALLAPTQGRSADPPKGQRVFTAGHSFHMPMPGPLDQIAKAAMIAGHKIAGTQGLGGSSVAKHWNLPDDKDKARRAIRAGDVDVLTLSPHFTLPDEAIDKFTALHLEHNANGRVTVQASWYTFDGPQNAGKKFKNADRDAADPVALRKAWAPWVEKLRAQAAAINERHKKSVVLVVPAGDALIRLRERVAGGEVPGFAKQSELFTDDLGHGKPPVAWLTAYCHFAVIYGRSPVGLPTPEALKRAVPGADADKLNRVLQEAAWAAVLAEPMSGVKAEKQP